MFTLGFKTNTDIFKNYPEAEVQRILTVLSNEIWETVPDGAGDDIVGAVRDMNGNTIGSWRLTRSDF